MTAVSYARGRALRRRIPSKASDEYYTPPEIFDALGLKFDLDVCAPRGGIEWIPAKRSFCIADDGLTKRWRGRVWMNPPYSQPGPWVEKFTAHGNGICLVPVTKSLWFEALWASEATIVLNNVRRKFLRYGKPQSILFATVFAALGDECQQAVRRLGPAR